MTKMNEHPFNFLVGRTIKDVRPMTDKELGDERWLDDIHGPPVCLVLDDGTTLYPSKDSEGNGPGALFGMEPGGPAFIVAIG